MMRLARMFRRGTRDAARGASGLPLALCGLALLALLLGGCKNGCGGDDVCFSADGVSLTMHRNGTFSQNYSYMDDLFPGNSNGVLQFGVNTGHWVLILPGEGSPDGRVYIQFQGIRPNGGGAVPPLNSYYDKLVPADSIPGVEKLLPPGTLPSGPQTRDV